MLRSMYSGISGLKNFQTKLDVIGNNIANVNTYGFKKERTIFKDLISQTQSGASGPSAARGGVNAIQVGLGSQLAAIDTVHNPGSMQTTGRGLDLAISGDGFFMVADSAAEEAPTPEDMEDLTANPLIGAGFTNTQYTRAGNFYMDKFGYVVNGDGKYLVGVPNDTLYAEVDPDATSESDADRADASQGTDNLYVDGEITPENGEVAPLRIPTNAQSMSIGQDGSVYYVDVNGKLQFAGQALLAKFPNASGLEKTGSNYFQMTANSGDPLVQAGTQAGIGSVNAGFLEMSNVDLSEEFTEMIVAQRGFQSNSRIITTSDEILQELVNLKR
ncbi:flagellar basal body rod protein FlgG [Solibacillus sp. R5-41]|uniref:flagellar basal body rod protein FlgG n=1 Tax=Solibacillus sp. R5-41 TaxID=2048654 RepID=UPI000C1259CC|nr:flagellar basal body rod protein FlgG [Solibacillus sp. R5-41]ATP39357.1 flagellar basal body rod protein FlgG [Solibacillus sp. R5-41]